jgi:hypothetical protein
MLGPVGKGWSSEAVLERSQATDWSVGGLFGNAR